MKSRPAAWATAFASMFAPARILNAYRDPYFKRRSSITLRHAFNDHLLTGWWYDSPL
jgi:hypothetical protein